MVEAVPHYRDSDLFTPRERAALRCAEMVAGDHRKATDGLFDEMREHFTESDIVDLGWRIVSFLAYGRLIHVFDLEAGKACPISKPPDSKHMKKVDRAREWARQELARKGEL